MELSKREEKQFSVIQTTINLLITLSTGFMVFTYNMSSFTGLKPLAQISWMLMLSSVISGLYGNYSIVSELNNLSTAESNKGTPNSPKIRTPAKIQLITFSLGLILFVAVFLYSSLIMDLSEK